MGVAPIRELVNAIAFATRPRYWRENDETPRSLRPSISAGALHPIDLLLIDWRGSKRVMHYNAWEHRLEILSVLAPTALDKLAQNFLEILPEAHGTAIVLVGQVSLVASSYENPVSLLWRDAGALLQTIGITASAYRLAFCPLGILGNEALIALGVECDDLLAAGCAVIGRDHSACGNL